MESGKSGRWEERKVGRAEGTKALKERRAEERKAENKTSGELGAGTKERGRRQESGARRAEGEKVGR